MTPEIWTIIGTGIALAALIVTLNLNVKADIKALDDRVRTLAEQLAKLEGKMDLLLQGLQIRIDPGKTTS